MTCGRIAPYGLWGPEQVIVCRNCGHANQAGSNFCSSCGMVLGRREDSTDTMAILEVGAEPGEELINSLIESAPRGAALLVVKSGPAAGTSFILEKPKTTIGRHPDSDIFLDDITVSRRHAEFVREGEEYSLSDVGSLNGTYVNHVRTDHEDLKSGDEVQIGKYRLLFIVVPKE